MVCNTFHGGRLVGSAWKVLHMGRKRKPDAELTRLVQEACPNENAGIELSLTVACAEARKIVEPYLVDNGKPFPLNGKTAHLAVSAPPLAVSAAALLCTALQISQRAESGDLGGLVSAAYAAGFFVHEVWGASCVGKPTYEALEAYERISRGGRKGTETTNEAHAELRSQYQPEVDQRMAGGANYTNACEQVAVSLGVNARTVANNTVNPAPRNRRKCS